MAAINYGPANFGDDLTAGLQVYFDKTAADNVFGPNPLLKYLTEDAWREEGGVSIRVPLEIATSSAVGSYSPYETLNVTPQQNFTTGNYPWRDYYATVTISHQEMRQNAGPKVFPLLQARARNAMASLRRQVWTDLWATSKVKATDIDPLPLLVDDTGTVGEVDGAVYAFWRSQDITSGPFTTQGVSDMRRLFDSTSNELDDPPTVSFTTQTVYELYEAETIKILRLAPARNADLSFQHLLLRGIPVMWDSKCPSGQLYMLNTRSTKLALDSGDEFTVGKFIEARDAKVMTSIITLRTNLITSIRKRDGRLVSIS
jgi:hypothetical protein